MLQFLGILCAAVAVFLSHCVCCSEGEVEGVSRPNIIIFLVDDLGYGDLSCYGHPTSITPNIQQLAEEGLLFTQFYTPAPVGSPSRAALLTGRYPMRSGIYSGIFRPDDLGGLPSDEITIATKLKGVGYKTGMIGKWQLYHAALAFVFYAIAEPCEGSVQIKKGVGEDGEHLPNHHGFDYYMGLPYSHSNCPCYNCFYPSQRCNQNCDPEFVPCPVFECKRYKQRIVQQPANLISLSATLRNSAVSFIKQQSNNGRPFFLYYAFQHTHGPQFSGELFRNTSSRGTFGDSLREVDYAVRKVIQALKDNAIYYNTFIFFTSDNGPDLSLKMEGGSAGHLRCGKGSTWEGGVRLPAIAWWAGKVRHGRTHQLTSLLDLFPTIMKMAGGRVPQDRKMDGMDITRVLFRKNGKLNRDWLPFFPEQMNSTEGPYALRYKSYKAHYYTKGGYCPENYYDSACRYNMTVQYHNPPLLFNLNSDPNEIFPLDTDKYSRIVEKIGLIKNYMMYRLEWGESQMSVGRNKTVQPCANSGCTPFPYCCSIDLLTPYQIPNLV